MEHKLDIGAILDSAKNYITKPLTLVEVVKEILSNAAGYFAARKDGSINNSLGFYSVVVVIFLICGLLGNLLTLNFLGLFLVAPATIVGALIGLAIGSVLIFIAAKLVAKGEGTFWESTQIACRLSWVFIIPAFPLWVFLPSIVQALFTIAAYLLWAYLAIPSAGVRFKISNGNHRIIIWLVAGVFSLIVLIAALTGTAVKKGIEFTNDRYTEEIERLQKEAVKNSEEILKAVEVQQKQLLEEMQKQQAAAEKASAEAEAAAKAAKAANK
jgi:hypothetical protein